MPVPFDDRIDGGFDALSSNPINVSVDLEDMTPKEICEQAAKGLIDVVLCAIDHAGRVRLLL